MKFKLIGCKIFTITWLIINSFLCFCFIVYTIPNVIKGNYPMIYIIYQVLLILITGILTYIGLEMINDK
jgi:archaellum biogenesis protein FlaJ (TadC family)